MENLKNASLFCLIGLIFPALAWAEAVGTLTHFGGIVHVTAADGTSSLLSANSEIKEGDTLKTEKSTFARIKFVDGGVVVLRPETVFKVDSYAYKANADAEHKDNIALSLLKGGVRSVTGLAGKRDPESFKLNTRMGMLGVRGTDFGVLLCNNDCGNIQTVSGKAPENGLYTDTAQGTTIVRNSAGSVEVHAGSFSFTPNANTLPKLVLPTQGIQVTLPPTISNSKNGAGGSDSNACSVQ
jgi:hypothetical protein